MIWMELLVIIVMALMEFLVIIVITRMELLVIIVMIWMELPVIIVITSTVWTGDARGGVGDELGVCRLRRRSLFHGLQL